jgi:hypothetical protein
MALLLLVSLAKADEATIIRSYRLSLPEVVTATVGESITSGDSYRGLFRALERSPFESRFLAAQDELIRLNSPELAVQGKESVLVYNQTKGVLVAKAEFNDHLTLEEVLNRSRYRNRVLRARVLKFPVKNIREWNSGDRSIPIDARETYLIESNCRSMFSNLLGSGDGNFSMKCVIGDSEEPFGETVEFEVSMQKPRFKMKSTVFLPLNQKRVIGVYSGGGGGAIAIEVEMGFQDLYGRPACDWVKKEKKDEDPSVSWDNLRDKVDFNADLPDGRKRTFIEVDRGYREWLERSLDFMKSSESKRDDPFEADDGQPDRLQTPPWYEGGNASLEPFQPLGLLDLKPYLSSRGTQLAANDYVVAVRGEPVVLVQSSRATIEEIKKFCSFTYRLNGMVELDVRLLESAGNLKIDEEEIAKAKSLKNFLSHQLDYVGEDFEFGDDSVEALIECRDLEDTRDMTMWFHLKADLPVRKKIRLPQKKWVMLRSDKVNGRWRSWVARWRFQRFDRN